MNLVNHQTAHKHNPTERFTGLADLYARCRPSYPGAAIDCIIEKCALNGDSLLVDIGAGTGISARLFAARGIPVIGIEPNDDMRRQAESMMMGDEFPAPRYRNGQAEATGLADDCADAVLCAQSFHWFETESALHEFHRILKPGGWVVLMWNERDERDPFTFAYGEVIRTAPQTKTIEGKRGRAGEVILSHPLFAQTCREIFANEQSLDKEGMIGRALSASYAPREPAAARRFQAELENVFTAFQKEGRVVLRYETSIYFARKPTETC